MDNESKFIIAAYQKKSFDLFNQVIVIEAKFQQQQELIESLNAKIQEFASANQQLVQQVKTLEIHVREREDQIKNISSSTPNPKAKRTTKRNPVKTEENVQDGGEF
jgi:predicted  nucleic acid-binding Zn-ribbon protein